MATKTFKELLVWQKAHQFVLNVYSYTARFPKEELYGLTAQFRRSAISIPANIAEGYKNQELPTKQDLEECQYYLVLSNDLGYGENKGLVSLLDEVSRMLEAYRTRILTPKS